MRTFGEQTRALRIAWALDGLFNVQTGYAHPSNAWLSKATGITINKVQQALAELEDGGAIVRRVLPAQPGRQRWRKIYPAVLLLDVTPTVGVRGNPQLLGVDNLSTTLPRRPRTQLAHAKLDAQRRERRAQQADPPQESGEQPNEHAGNAPPWSTIQDIVASTIAPTGVEQDYDGAWWVMVRDPSFAGLGLVPHGPHPTEAAAQQWLNLHTQQTSATA